MPPNQSSSKTKTVSEKKEGPKLSDFVFELFVLFIPLIYSLLKYNYKSIKCNRSKLDKGQSIVLLSQEQFQLCHENVDYLLIISIIIWIIINGSASFFHFLLTKNKKLYTLQLIFFFLLSFVYLFLSIMVIINSEDILFGKTEVTSLEYFCLKKK